MKCDECANFKPKPKPKPTGSICRGCHSQRCVTWAPDFDAPPVRCPYQYVERKVRWEPFYGKVVE